LSLSIERIESSWRLVYTRARFIYQYREAAVSNPESKHWSDEKADVVAVLTIFVSLVLAAIHFISTPV